MKKASYFPLIVLLTSTVTIQLFVATILLFKFFNFPAIENSYLSKLSNFDLIHFFQQFTVLLFLFLLWYAPIFLLMAAISIKYRKVAKYIPIITSIYFSFAFAITLASTMTEEIFTLCFSVASLFALVMPAIHNNEKKFNK